MLSSVLWGIPAPGPFPAEADRRLMPLQEKSLYFDDEVAAGGGCEAAGT